MAVYVLELVGPPGPYRRLLEDPNGAGFPSELESATSATGFQLHAFWPRDRVVHLIVEGDNRPEDLGELLAERIAGEGWDPRWYRVFAAEDPPADVEAGDRPEWIIERAVPPQFRSCEICRWAAIPPHRPSAPCGGSRRG
jgi:hypothetical protein